MRYAKHSRLCFRWIHRATMPLAALVLILSTALDRLEATSRQQAFMAESLLTKRILASAKSRGFNPISLYFLLLPLFQTRANNSIPGIQPPLKMLFGILQLQLFFRFFPFLAHFLFHFAVVYTILSSQFARDTQPEFRSSARMKARTFMWRLILRTVKVEASFE